MDAKGHLEVLDRQQRISAGCVAGRRTGSGTAYLTAIEQALDALLVQPWHGFEQRLGISVLGLVEYLANLALFLELAALHYEHPLARPSDDSKIVRDQYRGVSKRSLRSRMSSRICA